MNSAANSGIVLMVPKLFGIVLVLVILIFVFMFLVRRQDELEETLDASQKTIVECRQQRYQLMCQVIDMFGNGNPDVQNLTRLRDLYEKSDSEEREIMWEEKYVVVMKRYLEYAGQHVSPQMRKAWQMANQAVVENEENLSGARTAYENAKVRASAYTKPPLSYIAAAGDKIADLMRFHHEVKTEWENDDTEGTKGNNG